MGQSGEKSEIPLTAWLIKKHNNGGFQVINRFKWVVEEKVACCNDGETFSSSWTFTYLSDATMGDIHVKVYSLAAVRTSDSATRYGVGLEIDKKLVIFQDCYDYPGECHHEIFTKKSKPNLTGKLKCACENGDVFPGNFTAHR